MAQNAAFQIVTNLDDNYLYPLFHQVGERQFELAYISDYIWWLNGDKTTYLESRNIKLLRQTLNDFKTLADQACIALVYMPTKEHIYLPYSDPQGNQRYVLENGLGLQLDADGWLSFGELNPQNYNTVISRFENQREVVTEIAREAGLQVIDLTPAFQAAAPTAPPLYYTYDSHWTKNGHELAGRTVADFIQESTTCPTYR